MYDGDWGQLALALIGVAGAASGAGCAAAGFTAMVTAAIGAWGRHRSRHVRALAACGLGPERDGDGFEGIVGGHRVRYDFVRPHHVWSAQVPTGSLLVSRRQLRTAIGPEGTGDGPFDRLYTVRGRVTDRAWLTAPVRHALVKLAQVDVSVDRGWIRVVAGGFDRSHLDLLLEVRRALADASPDPTERMVRLANDPIPEIRRRILVAVAENDPVFGVALADRLRADADPNVQAQAALLTRDPVRLASVAARHDVAHDLRATAAEALLAVGSTSLRKAAGEALLAEARPSLSRCGVELLRTVGTDAEGALLRLVPVADGALLERVASALGEVGSLRSLPALEARRAKLGTLERVAAGRLDEAMAAIRDRWSVADECYA